MAEAETKEAAAEDGGKKKGKMPMILGIVAILVIAFLSMKLMGAKNGPPAPPPLELAQKPIDLDEFLVNLKDGHSYLRTKISLHMKKGFKEEEFKNLLQAVRDAIILVLSSQTLQEANSFKGKEDLKVEIAAQVNEILNEGGPKVHDETKPRTPRPEKQKVDYPDWDSQTGPVLKVYYTDFATQ